MSHLNANKHCLMFKRDSIGCTFGDGKCVIRAADGECVAQVPKKREGPCTVSEHKPDSANASLCCPF